MNRRVFIAILGVGLAGVFGFAAQLVKTVDGVAIASVKSDSAVVIASVKTIAGVDNTSGGGTTPPTFDVAGTDPTPTANVYAPNASVGNLTNGYVLVQLINFDSTSGPNTVVDSDAVSYTQLSSDTSLGIYVGIWGAAKGTRGAASMTVTVTYTASTAGWASFESFNGVNQGTPTRTASMSTATSAAVSTTVTTVANDLVADFAAAENGSLVVNGSQTQRFIGSNGGPSNNTAGSTKTATTTSTSMSWTCVSGDWFIFATPLVPAS